MGHAWEGRRIFRVEFSFTVLCSTVLYCNSRLKFERK